MKTRGLKGEVKTIINEKDCPTCKGTGELSIGPIDTNKGLMNLYDDCGDCDGTGKIKITVLKRRRSTKAKVQSF